MIGLKIKLEIDELKLSANIMKEFSFSEKYIAYTIMNNSFRTKHYLKCA